MATDEELTRFVQTIKDMSPDEALKIADNFQLLTTIIRKWHGGDLTE